MIKLFSIYQNYKILKVTIMFLKDYIEEMEEMLIKYADIPKSLEVVQKEMIEVRCELIRVQTLMDEFKAEHLNSLLLRTVFAIGL